MFGPIRIRRNAATLVAAIIWFALAAQLVGMMDLARAARSSSLKMLINYISFFTIQSSLLGALLTTLASLRTPPPLRMMQASTTYGVAVYIMASALIYHFHLYGLLQPRGFLAIADVLLHYVVPVLFVAYCLWFTPKGSLRCWHPFVWLIYPIAYLVYVFMQGAWSGQYPYPLLDPSILPPQRLRRNAIGLLIYCLAIGLAFYSIDRTARKLASNSEG